MWSRCYFSFRYAKNSFKLEKDMLGEKQKTEEELLCESIADVMDYIDG